METVKSIIKNNGGIAKTADFVAEGLTNYDVAPSSVVVLGKFRRFLPPPFLIPFPDL